MIKKFNTRSLVFYFGFYSTKQQDGKEIGGHEDYDTITQISAGLQYKKHISSQQVKLIVIKIVNHIEQN